MCSSLGTRYPLRRWSVSLFCQPSTEIIRQLSSHDPIAHNCTAIIIISKAIDEDDEDVNNILAFKWPVTKVKFTFFGQPTHDAAGLVSATLKFL